jgi:hypothetical protein
MIRISRTDSRDEVIAFHAFHHKDKRFESRPADRTGFRCFPKSFLINTKKGTFKTPQRKIPLRFTIHNPHITLCKYVIDKARLNQ